MENYERTLVLGALPSSRAFLIYAMESPEVDTLATLEAAIGPLDPLDLRKEGGDMKAMHAAAQERIAKNSTLTLLVGSDLPVGANELLEEVLATQSDNEARVVAICSGDPSDELLALFGLRITGMKVVHASREAQDRAEAELKAAQERARESSRRHGLV